MLLSLFAVAAALPCLFAAPLEQRTFESGPLLSQNFPDPSYIQINETYYAFSTNNDGINVPIATSTDFQTWTTLDDDALHTVGSWSNGSEVWAPNVVQVVRQPLPRRAESV